MAKAETDSPQDAFRLERPARLSSAVVFASPHSGRVYPSDLLARTTLERRVLRSSEDAFVDQFLTQVPAHGAALLTAMVPRAYVDLNRAEDELDPALIEGLGRGLRSPRVVAGLGVIPRVVGGGRAIYSGKISLAEAQGRIERYWQPYHKALRALIAEADAAFGRAIVLDFHSMPSEAVAQMGSNAPDIVIGDRFGGSARREVTRAVEAAFFAAGFRVSRNTPFAGAYVTQKYGGAAGLAEVIQIEINRGLYLDEVQVTPLAGFDAFVARISGVVARLARLGAAPEDRLAAE